MRKKTEFLAENATGNIDILTLFFSIFLFGPFGNIRKSGGRKVIMNSEINLMKVFQSENFYYLVWF